MSTLAFTGFCRLTARPSNCEASSSSGVKIGLKIRERSGGSREMSRSALSRSSAWKRSNSCPVIFRSGFIPRRTRTSSSTAIGAPTASVAGPTLATAKSGGRSQTGRPLIARFWNDWSPAMARMAFGAARRASTRTNSRVSPVSLVVIARVMRVASRGRFNPGVEAAAPTNPGHSLG